MFKKIRLDVNLALLGAISFSLLILELAFIRILNVQFFPKITSTVITLSLFSLSIGGIFVVRIRRQQLDLNHFIDRTVGRYLVATGFSFLALLLLQLYQMRGLEVGWTLFVLLSFVYLLISVPMCFGGALVAALFSQSEKASDAYIYDMFGAALGVLVFYFGFIYIGPTGLVSLSLFLILFVKSFGESVGRYIVLLAVAFGILNPVVEKYGTLHPLISKYSNYEERVVVKESFWDQEAYISVADIFNKNSLKNSDPARKVIFFDGGSMSSMVYPFDGDYIKLQKNFLDRPEEHFNRLTVTLAHFLKKDSEQSVFILGSGAGQEVKAALMFGAEKVYAADISRSVLDLSKNRFSTYNGNIYNHPNVRLFHGEGRSVLFNINERFDIIQMFSAYVSSSMAESKGALEAIYFLTVEAFKEYFLKLKPDGIIQVNQYIYKRILSTAATAWSELGRDDFSSHVVVIERRRRDIFTTVLINMKPWTEDDLIKIEEFLESHPSEKYDISERPGMGRVGWYLKGAPSEEQYDRGRIDLRPTRDDWPFFASFAKIFSKNDREVVGVKEPVRKFIRQLRVVGPLDVLDYTLLVFVLAIFIIFLVIRQVKTDYFRQYPLEYLYLFLVGITFISFEFLLIYLFQMISHSSYMALILVIGSLTFSAGLGQVMFRRFKLDSYIHSPFFNMGIAGCMAISLVLFLDRVAELRSIETMGLRYVVITLILSFFGFMLGQLFPAILQKMKGCGEGALEMGWVLNAVGLVVGGVSSLVLFRVFGFGSTGWLLAGCYVVMALISYIIGQRPAGSG